MGEIGRGHVITDEAYGRLAQVAALLLPGDESAPAAADLPNLRTLLECAVRAVGSEEAQVEEALALLPAVPSWQSLQTLDETHRDLFDVLAAVAAGAYFMSPAALEAIGYPHGPRTKASVEQIVDEIETGILEPMLDRASMVREVPA